MTLSVDAELYGEAKALAQERGVAISRLVELYLDFLVHRKLNCFSCGAGFSSHEASVCPRCGWLKCPDCQSCRCSLDEPAGEVAFHLRRTLEDLVGERIG